MYMAIEVKTVTETRTMEVKLLTEGKEETYLFNFYESSPGSATVQLGGVSFKVALLRKAIGEFVDRYPLEFEQ